MEMYVEVDKGETVRMLCCDWLLSPLRDHPSETEDDPYHRSKASNVIRRTKDAVTPSSQVLVNAA